MRGPPFKRCMEIPYNQGHFEDGRFIPDCKMCGKCCEGFWLTADVDEDYLKFDLMHQGTKKEGRVIHVYAPCRHLIKIEKDGDLILRGCAIHESERPSCCTRFGFGDFYHPPGCVFLGGDVDKELSPHIDQE